MPTQVACACRFHAPPKADEQLLLVRDAIEKEEPGRRDARGKAVQRTAQDSAPARTTSMRRLCAGGRAAAHAPDRVDEEDLRAGAPPEEAEVRGMAQEAVDAVRHQAVAVTLLLLDLVREIRAGRRDSHGAGQQPRRTHHKPDDGTRAPPSTSARVARRQTTRASTRASRRESASWYALECWRRKLSWEACRVGTRPPARTLSLTWNVTSRTTQIANGETLRDMLNERQAPPAAPRKKAVVLHSRESVSKSTSVPKVHRRASTPEAACGSNQTGVHAKPDAGKCAPTRPRRRQGPDQTRYHEWDHYMPPPA